MPNASYDSAPYRPLRGERFWLLALLIMPLLALYAPGLGYPLVFDDLNAAVLDPSKRRALLDGGGGIVRWLSNASFIWTVDIFGWFLPLLRLQNLLLHCANVILLYTLLQALFNAVLGRSATNVSRHRWWAALGALWFGFNPAAVYATAYLIQRSTLMATCFSLLALHGALRAMQAERARGLWAVAAALAYVMALLSKEHAVLLPALMLAMALLLLPQVQWRRWRWFLLVLALAAVGFAVLRRATIAQPYEGHALAMLGMQEVMSGQRLTEYAYPLSVLTQCGLFFKYLLLWIVPLPEGMSIDMHPALFLSIWGGGQLVALLGFGAWGVAGILLLRRGGAAGLAGFGLLWPWLLFGTELATVRVQEIFVLYRSYLWMAGLPFLIPLALTSISPRIVRLLVPALLIGLVPPAWDRLYSFSSNLRLWTDAVEKSGGRLNVLNGRAWMYRGVARMKAGDLSGGGADLEQAMKLDPWFAEPYGNRAVIALRQGRLDDALRDSNYALEIDPGLEVFRRNRELILRLMQNKNAP